MQPKRDLRAESQRIFSLANMPPKFGGLTNEIDRGNRIKSHSPPVDDERSKCVQKSTETDCVPETFYRLSTGVLGGCAA